MRKKRVQKILLSFIVVFGLYSLFEFMSTEIEEQIEVRSTDPRILAAHFQLPRHLRGRKLPFHRIYEPRQVGYPKDLSSPKQSNGTKIILLWTPWNGVTKTINYYFLQSGNKSFVTYNCPNTNCAVTNDREKINIADAVLFHLLDTKSSDLPSYRTAEQVWILYNMEPPWLIWKHKYTELAHLNNKFNWTMSYRSDSDVVARYGFVMSSNEEVSIMPFQNKTKSVVWFVSDCITDSKREDYVNELKKYIDVDIYGLCGTFRCYPAQSSMCYDKILAKYKFYLSFENALCKDYVTEKYFNIFNYDIIPVVFGTPNYSLIGHEGTFIDATSYPKPQILANILHKIGNNEDEYKKFLLKKQSFKAFLDPWMCRMCEKLHSNNKSAILHDVEKWWISDAQCKTWDKTRQKFDDTKFS